MAMLLASCTQDELTDRTGEALPEPIPLQLTAAIGEAVATPATRGTVDNSWDGDEVIYVQVASNKDAGFTSEAAIDWANIEPILYTVGIDGTLTLKDPTKQVYWQATSETLYIRAWCAGTGADYTDIPMPGNSYTWSTPKDQSTSDALKQADFLFAYRSMTFEERTINAGLEFSHLTSKISINLVNSSYLKQYDPAKVSVSLITTVDTDMAWYVEGAFRDSGSGLNLFEGTNGNRNSTITPFKRPYTTDEDYYASYEAIVIPQDVAGRYKGIQVTVNNTTYVWGMTLSSGYQMESGKEYTFDITVKEQGLEVSAGSSIDWSTGGSGSGSVTLPIEIDLSQATGAITISDDKAYLLKGTGSKPVKINGNATVILQGVSLTTSTGNAISVESGSPTIRVKGTNNSVTGNNAGIYVAEGSTLTITGDSSDDILTANGGNGGSGIGGYVLDYKTSYACGNISITNVTVYAHGSKDNMGNYSPGIGCGGNAACGTITIDNATVHAYGYGNYDAKYSAPAIGCGAYFVNGCPSSIPVVIIQNDSEVHAHRGENNANLPTDYIGWPGDASFSTAASSTINCGINGGVYNSTVYCYTGDTPDKTVVYDENGNEL